MNWYMQSQEDVSRILKTNLDSGLTDSMAKNRLDKYGHNELKEEPKEGLLTKIIDQFSDFLVIILLVAAFISISVGEIGDSIVIIAVVIINAALGIYQESRAEKTLEALRKITSPSARVLRNEEICFIPAARLVPGDIVILETGDIIPADLRLIESSSLKIEEASLTGESLPVEKDSFFTSKKEVPLGDRYNMAYGSTIVTQGRGRGIVVETGHNTEIGKIATVIQSNEEELTPLQKSLNELGKYLGIVTIAVCFIVFVIGLLQGREILEIFMVAISLAVAAIPEGLPAIVTIVLALAMNQMVKEHVIVKKLLAVETLGSITAICSDKTGTLTKNEMTAVKVYANNKVIDVTGIGYEPVGQFKRAGEDISLDKFTDLETLLSIATLTNDASLTIDDESNLYKIIGDPTEGALITLGEKANMTRTEMNDSFPRIGEIPFDSNRKMMTSFHKNFLPNKIVSFTKGAPDIIIKKCSHISIGGEIIPFTNALKEKTLSVNNYFAKDALRVLGFAYRQYDKLPLDKSSENIEEGMIFVGLVGMIDPSRPEARDSIKRCKKAGIKPIMITGDYKETAFAIAKKLGIARSIKETIVGEELDEISDLELKNIVEEKTVYARVSPEHKVRIITALKEKEHIVAMTGDGVNDAMALSKADIGVAMGITGTDVAKNTADIILTDDNFSSIVSAVEQGRIIYSNIKKFVYFLLSCNVGEIILVFASILLNLPVPLLPIQLLWLNLVTDSFPALALGVEEGDPDIMESKPREAKSSIIDNTMVMAIIIESISIAGASLLAYVWGVNTFPDNLSKARTITFATLITAELLRAYSSRSQKYLLFEIGLFTNMTMIYATGFSFLLLLSSIYIPFMQDAFHTIPLGLLEWGIVFTFSIFPLVIGELYKALFCRD